jgi:prevent-host-death family protein
MDVGIRELKKHLSEYVEKAARGQLVQVTSRGKPIAHLGPLPGRVRVDEGIEEGWITPAGDHDPVDFEPESSNTTMTDVLVEDRGN